MCKSSSGLEMATCYVVGCKNKRREYSPQSDINFYLIRKYSFNTILKAIGRNPESYSNRYICSEHFTANDYIVTSNRKYLKLGVVPTRNLPKKDNNKKKSPLMVRTFQPNAILSLGENLLTSVPSGSEIITNTKDPLALDADVYPVSGISIDEGDNDDDPILVPVEQGNQEIIEIDTDEENQEDSASSYFRRTPAQFVREIHNYCKSEPSLNKTYTKAKQQIVKYSAELKNTEQIIKQLTQEYIALKKEVKKLKTGEKELPTTADGEEQKKASTWEDEETRSFIKLIEERDLMVSLHGRFRAEEVFRNLEQPMKEKGYIKSKSQMLSKYKELCMAYDKARRGAKHMEDDTILHSFPYAAEMRRLLNL